MAKVNWSCAPSAHKQMLKGKIALTCKCANGPNAKCECEHLFTDTLNLLISFHQCSITKMLKCSRPLMIKCANAQMLKGPNDQMHKCSNAQVLKWSNTQLPNAPMQRIPYCTKVNINIKTNIDLCIFCKGRQTSGPAQT